jgi:hypothetical protein
MPSTSDLQCKIEQMDASIKEEMRQGFDALGGQVQNVLRALDDDHEEVMLEFLKVEAILTKNTIVLGTLQSRMKQVLKRLNTNTNLHFHAEKLRSIEVARTWFNKWTEEEPETRFGHFTSPKGKFWCDEFVAELGGDLLPQYIADWVESPEFLELSKPSPCTPESYLAQYSANQKSFDALFEFVGIMKFYISGYSSAAVTTIDGARSDMAKTFGANVKAINEMTTC